MIKEVKQTRELLSNEQIAYIKDFWKRRAEIEDPTLATHFKLDDCRAYDLSFIRSVRTSPFVSVLDLGSGSCDLSLTLAEEGADVVAVDWVQELLDKAPQHRRLKKIASSVISYTTQDKFDLILLFGVCNYLTDQELNALYVNCRSMMKRDATLIVKHQCGVSNDVLVDGPSMETRSRYCALYRHFRSDLGHLERHFPFVQMHDIYPARLNRWENTHFYAFTAKQFC